jgi:metallophosphoesterase superfamily enzyme
MDIKIIGTIDPDQEISQSIISSILKFEQQALEHGSAFTGRPTTSIYQGAGYVIKLRTEPEIAYDQLTDLGKKKLVQERALNIYHPAKTWFVLETQDAKRVGNITPLLSPLHTLDQRDSPLRLTQALSDCVRLTLTSICTEEVFLDLSLSNFALDEQDQIYYLDDDVYPLNEITPLASSIAVLLRHLDDLPNDAIHQLGTETAGLLEELACPNLSSWKLKLALGQQFMANEAQQSRLLAFIKGLENKPAEKTIRPGPATKRQELIALIADIHANLPALEVIDQEIQRLQPDRVIVLGDIVGYGPHPRECIELLRNRAWDILKGNHDNAAALTIPPTSGFSTTSGWVIEWTQKELSDEHRDWLGALESRMDEADWIAVHGAPMDSNDFNAYVYHMTYEDNLDYLLHHDKRLGFHGHTHLQGTYLRKNETDTHIASGTIELEQVHAALICPGSVGQPRGGAAGAEMAVLRDFHTLEFMHFEYDKRKTQQDMKQLGFPQTLIDRLSTGR